MTQTFDRVADFVLETDVAQIPQSTRHSAALMLLDTLGVLIASGPMNAGRIARDTASLLYASTDTKLNVRMLFDGRRVSLAGAAYAAATQTDNLDGHDGYNPSKGHIGVVAVPALSALMQTVDDISGPEALAAITIGYEVAGRAGISLHATVSDYHTSGAWNALGVVALAARLRKMTRGQMRQAMGIAEYHGPRSQMMREIANPTMLHDGSGWGAMVGLSAAILAEQGFTGAPAITIENDDVVDCWDDLGQFWQMEHQYVKPYPICRWAHAAIDATRLLMLEHNLCYSDISAAQINTFEEAACLYPGMPDDTSKAQYSLAFAVATMMAYGQIGVEHITNDGLKDGLVGSLIGRINISSAEVHSKRFPQYRYADVVLTLKDGRVLKSGDVHARGGPESPISESDIIDKYMAFATTSISKNRAAGIRDAVLNLVLPESRYIELGRLLYDPPE